MSDAKRVAEELKASTNTLARKIMIELQNRVIVKTPVDTGRAKNNWQVGLTGPVRSTLSGLDKTGASRINTNTGKVLKSKPGRSIWLSNNLDYINDLENGTSRQFTTGMVRTSIAEVSRLTFDN